MKNPKDLLSKLKEFDNYLSELRKHTDGYKDARTKLYNNKSEEE